MALFVRFNTLLVGLMLISAATVGAERNPVDPWEAYNRKAYAFNDALDRYLLKPTAKGYKAVAPEFVEIGVANFFDNLFEVRNLVNDLLQGQFTQAGRDGGRFLINTSLGIAGFIDVAKHMGLTESDGEDFGQTLSVWGVGQGPYLVLPFFGVSTVRDAFGMPVNAYLNPIAYVDHVPTRNSLYGTNAIDARTSLLDAEVLISGDPYIFTRDAYLQRRQFLINNGALQEDSFGSDEGF